MAGWRGQVWKIRESLRKKGLSHVDVGTVEVSDLFIMTGTHGKLLPVF